MKQKNYNCKLFLESICGTERSHCHEYATCTDLGSGDYRCTCNKGFSGNGTLCIGKNFHTFYKFIIEIKTLTNRITKCEKSIER